MRAYFLWLSRGMPICYDGGQAFFKANSRMKSQGRQPSDRANQMHGIARTGNAVELDLRTPPEQPCKGRSDFGNARAAAGTAIDDKWRRACMGDNKRQQPRCVLDPEPIAHFP